MKLDVNHYPSRAKTGRAAYCVDTRYVLEDGEQKYFATKQEAHAYIDRLEDELQLNTDGAWDWTFYDLLGFEKDGDEDKPVGAWVKHLQSEYDKGKISKSSWSENIVREIFPDAQGEQQEHCSAQGPRPGDACQPAARSDGCRSHAKTVKNILPALAR